MLYIHIYTQYRYNMYEYLYQSVTRRNTLHAVMGPSSRGSAKEGQDQKSNHTTRDEGDPQRNNDDPWISNVYSMDIQIIQRIFRKKTTETLPS